MVSIEAGGALWGYGFLNADSLTNRGTIMANDFYRSARRAGGIDPVDLTIQVNPVMTNEGEIVATAERHRGRSLVVAVTNDPSSALASLGDVVIPLDAGREASGIACRTFRATVAALALLAGVAGVDDLREAVDGLAKRVATPGDLDAAADDLDGAPSIDVDDMPGL